METNAIEMYEQLQELFERWKKEFEERGDKNFCKDGLVVLSEREPTIDEKFALWCEKTPRVMLLLNDLNGNSCKDGTPKDQTINNNFFPILRFHRNAGRFLYAAKQWYNKEKILEFKEIREKFYRAEDRVKIFEIPYAHVNIKKAVGGNYVSPKTMACFFEKYKKFLKEEIEILNPQIIINSSKISNEQILPLCGNIPCVKADHPSARRKEHVMYEEFVKKLKRI